MKRNFSYLKYILRHKYFVAVAKFRLSLFCGALLAIIHDSSKFRPSEWFPYAETFYTKDGKKQYIESDAFNVAWNHHQKRNKHHWQYWALNCDDGRVIYLEMPIKYVYEMVADWAGAGRAITGRWEVKEWYSKNNHKIFLHEKTRQDVTILLELL